MKHGLQWYAALLGLGSCWGLSIPLAKLAVSTGHQPLGLIFWQLLTGILLLGTLARLRGISLPITRNTLFFCSVIAVLGTLLPNSFSYVAAAKLPAGIMAIVISMVPIFALPIAIFIGLERINLLRFAGILLGAIAIIILIAPSTDLTTKGASLFVLVALIAPLCYATEDNFVAIKGSAGLDPLQVILGASIIGFILAIPLVAISGQWVSIAKPWGVAEWALLGTSILHSFAYVGYIWLIGKTGPVFASTVAYFVTGTGVIWSMLLLGERYSGPIWLSLGLMLVAMTLVRPRQEHETPAS